MQASINYIAVLLAALAGMVIGFLWYSKPLFGRPWSRLMGYTDQSLKEAQKSMGQLYGISLVFALLTAYVLAHVMVLSRAFYGTGAVAAGLTSVLFMWLGFVMPVQFTGEMFGSKKWKLFAINTGYQLASLLAAGIVIGLFG